MFRAEKQSNQSSITCLMKKKQLLQVKIRQQEKNRIINQLREVAFIPEDITKCLNSLPESIYELFDIINNSQNWNHVWHKAVAVRVLAFLKAQLKNIDQEKASPTNILVMVCYVMVNTVVEQQTFDQVLVKLKEIGKNWKAAQKQKILKLLIKALTLYQDKKYFSQAKELLNMQSRRFTTQALEFYNYAIKKHPILTFQENILTDQICWRLVQSLGFVFYSISQKIKICEILVQTLYQSNQQQVSKNWNLSALFQALQFLISFASDHKLLTQRCLFLIYNVNIDAGSKIFLIHSCADIVLHEMKNKDLPLKLRELMAQTYLSALFNLQAIYQTKYLKNYNCTFISAISFILQEFSQTKFIIESTKSLFQNLFKLQSTILDFDFKQMIINRSQLLDAIKQVEFGQEFIQEWQLQ